ncbi:BTB/POZ domain-containing protein At1g67900-like [Apium graveolens]|uniref:BTB/POZ domain-containing protein At1g67900-like n=1 Tax=Apium graveolens TaxID=4045 RepID=UPI003D7A9B1C
MKFMKLGTRPDTFCTNEGVRSVSSEISSDLTVQVEDTRFVLHKFPLLSKCLHLQQLCSESPESSSKQVLVLPDFPGGIEAFELCAKFCYSITITISAYNIVSARCAAEYLHMTEDVEKGNLTHKLEIFLNSCILHGWKDSIVTLKSTKAFNMRAEDLGITSRSIEAIASKVLSNPTKVNLSHSYSRRGKDDAMSCNGAEDRSKTISKGWWAEDVAELGIDFYWRTMVAIKSSGKIPSNIVGDALRIYASRWLPEISKTLNNKKQVKTAKESIKHRFFLESLINLLPVDRYAVPCSFLLKLLKAANILEVSSSSMRELAKRIGMQLEEATVGDLLIPNMSNTCKEQYDVDIIITILEQFMLQGQSPPTSPPRAKGDFHRRRSRSAENISEFQESRRSSSASHSSKLRVARLMDGYLQVVACDANLALLKFIAIAEAIPEFARLGHDDLYRAIDIYLKGHPELNKSGRKRLCRVLDCKKLSIEACTHAAQNELLPLRVVVQVLFFKQARAAIATGQVINLPSNIKALLGAQDDPSRLLDSLLGNKTLPPDDQWSVSGLKTPNSSISTLKMKLAEKDELNNNYGEVKSSQVKENRSIPSRPRGMFSRFWTINRQASGKI